ncbi:unnamed protein product [Allacma fusca]|uniref:Thioredoxin-like fold domain-containing protein n=1 Tax=Allacma fusca TaxID=39272 RepID=A0A8J2LFE7_9HEXA|nr:unnamed protein product [Allacma fusca]
MNACYVSNDEGHLSPVYPVKIEFNEQIEWIQTTSPRSDLNEDSASNIIVFDFFTHCCINCIHSIEDLRQVESHIRSLDKTKPVEGNIQCGFKLLSIHSPKFTTEKQTESIRSSVQRMKMDHTEVLNDPETVLWRQLGIYCWPTVLVFGPNINPNNSGPNLLFVLTGEGHKEFLQVAVEVAMDFFQRNITEEQVEKYKASLERKGELKAKVCKGEDVVDSDKGSMLRFPGKVSVFGDLICISDSGNNRIVISDLAGEILHIIGGPEGGYEDGDFAVSRFYNPQGIAFKDADVIFVADTGNHAVRQVSLVDKKVTTLVQPEKLVPEHNTKLKSPWDLSFYSPNVLLVAAAGTHQIFGYFFESTTLFNKPHDQNTFDLVAGSGREENRNNMYLLKSSFAQPSGITSVGSEVERVVYLADSESSSIRTITPQGRVMALVGGNRDPQNLFTYGDEDGVSYDVKLQHPMGVCAAGIGKVFIADTYNHKVKMINVETKHCSTLIGDGTAGNKLGIFVGNVKPKRLGLAHPSSTNIGKSSPLALLNEPAGISIDAKNEYIYIADTNNHSIKVGHLQEQIVSELLLKLPQPGKGQSPPKSSTGETFDQQFTLEINKSVRNFTLTLILNKIPNSFEGGSWKVICPVLSPKPSLAGSLVRDDTTTTSLTVHTEELPFVPWMRELYILLTVLYCQDNACHRRDLKLLVNFALKKEPLLQVGTEENFIIDFTPAEETFGG